MDLMNKDIDPEATGGSQSASGSGSGGTHADMAI